jgi:hypothetical protein
MGWHIKACGAVSHASPPPVLAAAGERAGGGGGLPHVRRDGAAHVASGCAARPTPAAGRRGAVHGQDAHWDHPAVAQATQQGHQHPAVAAYLVLSVLNLLLLLPCSVMRAELATSRCAESQTTRVCTAASVASVAASVCTHRHLPFSLEKMLAISQCCQWPAGIHTTLVEARAGIATCWPATCRSVVRLVTS